MMAITSLISSNSRSAFFCLCCSFSFGHSLMLMLEITIHPTFPGLTVACYLVPVT